MAITTIQMREGKELVGENGQRYLLVQAMGQPNVWIAVDAATQEKLYIVKQPSDDDDMPGWPRFQHEMVMHELFKEHDAIRPQLDRIPPTSHADPPKLVLELLQTTLWDARRKREFSDAELKQVMRQILLGLQEVHQRGLVYADLKMENILLSNFVPSASSSTPSSTSPNPSKPDITAKLGDLGIVMSPMRGTVQPLAYRAPEVYFRQEITPAADIWSWGLIYCQLLEAQASFQNSGLYDELLQGNGTGFVQKELSVRRAIAKDFDLGGVRYYDGCGLEGMGREGGQWEALRRKGVGERAIGFLKWILNPVPGERPTAEQILNSEWLASTFREDATPASTSSSTITPSTTTPAHPPAQKPRKNSEPSLVTKLYNQITNTKRDRSPDSESSSQTREEQRNVRPTPLTDFGTREADAAVNVREQKGVTDRPGTARSSSVDVGTGTFLNYGGLMG